MLIKLVHQIKAPKALNLFLVFVYVTAIVNSSVESRKLDETTVSTTTNNTDEKCTPCGNNYYSPPPPVILPPPPPPPPKKSPSKYCPPPPPSSFIYITGPPGNLYPVDENFSGANHRYHRSFTTLFLLPILVGFISMIAFW